MEPPPRTKAVATELRPDLVEGLVSKAEELDLGHRDHAAQGKPEGSAGNRGLGERRIEDPLGAEALE